MRDYRRIETDYSITEIDADGDAIDPRHYDSKREVNKDWRTLPKSNGMGYILREHKWMVLRYNGEDVDSDNIGETIIGWCGDVDAMKAHGWHNEQAAAVPPKEWTDATTTNGGAA